AAVTVPGPYVVPAYSLETIVVFTNKVPTTPVRGAGRPQAVFAMERLLDRVAHELRLDRTEVRRRNFIKPEQMPYPVGLLYRDGKPLFTTAAIIQKHSKKRCCSPTMKPFARGSGRPGQTADSSASALPTMSRAPGSVRLRA